MSATKKTKFDEEMNVIRHEITQIHADLEALKNDENGASRLLPIQQRIRAIDSKRVQGQFVFQNEVPPGQAELVIMLEECYGLVYEIQNGFRVLSRELLSIKNDLMWIQTKESKPTYLLLAPLQDRLNAVTQRVGYTKYVAENGEIPAGQAKLFELIQICYELKNAVEARI